MMGSHQLSLNGRVCGGAWAGGCGRAQLNPLSAMGWGYCPSPFAPSSQADGGHCDVRAEPCRWLIASLNGTDIYVDSEGPCLKISVHYCSVLQKENIDVALNVSPQERLGKGNIR